MSPKAPNVTRRRVLLTTVGCVSTLAGCNSASLSFTDDESKKDKVKDHKPLDSPWPTTGATPQRTGVASDARLPPTDAEATPAMKRDDPAYGGIEMAPVVADGTAYATAATGHVIARGTHEWTVSVDAPAGLTPTIADGTVYAPTTSVSSPSTHRGRTMANREQGCQPRYRQCGFDCGERVRLSRN